MPTSSFAIDTRSLMNSSSPNNAISPDVNHAKPSPSQEKQNEAHGLRLAVPRADQTERTNALPNGEATLHSPKKSGGSDHLTQRVKSAQSGVEVVPNAPSPSTAGRTPAVSSKAAPQSTNTTKAESYINLSALRRPGQRADLTGKARPTSGAVVLQTAARQQQTPPRPLQVSEISTPAHVQPRDPQENLSKASANSPSLSSLSPAADVQIAQMPTARTQAYHPPRIFNRGTRTEVISVHGSSSSNSSNDSVEIQLGYRESPMLSVSPPHPSGRGRNKAAATPIAAAEAAAVEVRVTDCLQGQPTPTMEGGAQSCSCATPRPLAGVHTATNSMDSQLPPLTDMTHVPESLLGSSWENSLADTANSSQASGAKSTSAKAAAAATTRAAVVLRDRANRGAASTRSGRRGREVERGKGQLPGAADAAATAGSVRSGRTAVFLDHSSHAEATDDATAAMARVEAGEASSHSLAQSGSHRAAPPVYLRRVSQPPTTSQKATTAASTDDPGEHVKYSVRESNAAAASFSREREARSTLQPAFSSASPARPSSADYEAFDAAAHDGEHLAAHSETKQNFAASPQPHQNTMERRPRPTSLRDTSDCPDGGGSSPRDVLQPPPTTRAPMSLSASCPSHEALQLLNATVVDVALHEPPHELTATSNASPTASTRRSLLSDLSAPPVQRAGTAGPVVVDGSGAADGDAAAMETDTSALAALTRLEQSPSLPHSTQLQRSTAAPGVGASQRVHRHREGEISGPQLTTVLAFPAIQSRQGEAFFTSPLGGAAVGNELTSTSTSDFYRHPARFTAAPQLVPEASQEFFVRGAQRMGNFGIVPTYGTPPQTTLPAQSASDERSTVQSATTLQGRTVAREMALNGKDGMGSGYHFDIRSTSSAPHPLMALVLDARRLPLAATPETVPVAEASNVPEIKQETTDVSSRGISSDHGIQKSVHNEALFTGQPLPVSPNRNIDNAGNLVIYKPSAEVEGAGGEGGGKKETDGDRAKGLIVLGGAHSKGENKDVPSGGDAQASSTPQAIVDAAAFCVLVTADAPQVTSTIDRGDGTSGFDNRNLPIKAKHGVLVPGETKLLPSHPAPSPTPLSTNLMPMLTQLPSSTDMSTSSSSVMASSLQLSSRRAAAQRQLASPASPSVSRASVLLAGERYRYSSLSTSPLPNAIRLVRPLPGQTAMPLASTVAAAPPSTAAAPVATLHESQVSSPTPPATPMSAGVLGHSAALNSTRASSDWSASVPPPPVPPPLRFYDMHTQVQLPASSPRPPLYPHVQEPPRSADTAKNVLTGFKSEVNEPSSRVEAVLMPPAGAAEKNPGQERSPTAAVLVAEEITLAAFPPVQAKAATATVSSARAARVVLRSTRSAAKRTKARKRRHGQLPAPASVRLFVSEKEGGHTRKESNAAVPLRTHAVRDTSMLYGTKDEIDGTAAATAVAATAALLVEEHNAGASSRSSAKASPSSSTVSLASPPQTVEPSHSLPRQVHLVCAPDPLAQETNQRSEGEQPPAPLKCGTAGGERPVPDASQLHIMAAHTAARVSAERADTLPFSPQRQPSPVAHNSNRDGSVSAAPAEAAAAAAEVREDTAVAEAAASTPRSSPAVSSASPAPLSRRLAVRRMPAGERSAKAARTTAALPTRAATTTDVVPATVTTKPAARALSAQAEAISAGPAAHPPPQRDITATLAREGHPSSYSSASPPGGTQRHVTSPRVQVLPSRSPSPPPLAQGDATPAPAAVKEGLVVPRALPLYHFQGTTKVAARYTTVSSSPSYFSTPLPSPMRAPSAPRNSYAGEAAAAPSPARAAATGPTAAVPVFGRGTAVAASPYARAPTYNRPQAFPAGTNDLPQGRDETQRDLLPEPTPAARSTPRRATRLSSTPGGVRTPLASERGWAAREAQLANTPGTDFAPSVIPATSGTADSRAASPEASALMHALGDWTPVRESPQQQQAIVLDTAVEHPAHQRATRRSRKQMRSNRTGGAAARLLPVGVPRERRRASSTSSAAREGVEAAHAPSTATSPHKASEGRRETLPLPSSRAEDAPATAPAAVTTPAPSPRRRAAATSPPPQRRPSPLASSPASRPASHVRSTASSVSRTRESESSLVPAARPVERSSFGSQTDRVPLLRTAPLPAPASPARSAASASLPRQLHSSGSRVEQRVPSAASSPPSCRPSSLPPSQHPLQQAQSCTVIQPSPPVTPKRARLSASPARCVLATPPAHSMVGAGSVESPRASEGDVVREVLAGGRLGRNDSPVSPSRTSLPSSCLQVQQRQAGYRSYLPRTLPSLSLTPDPIAASTLSPSPAALHPRPHSVEAAERVESRKSSRRARHPSSGSGGGGAFGMLGALGQKMIPLWWRRGRRRSGSDRSSDGASSPAQPPASQLTTPTTQSLPFTAHELQQHSPQAEAPLPRRSPQLMQPRQRQQQPQMSTTPQHRKRSGDFLFPAEPPLNRDDGTENDAPYEPHHHHQQQRQSPRPSGAQSRSSDAVTAAATERDAPYATAGLRHKSSPIPATPPAPHLSHPTTAVAVAVATEEVQRCGAAVAGQPLRSASSHSAVASTSVGSLPGGLTNYYGAYQRSLHHASPLPSRPSPSPLTSNTPSNLRGAQAQPHTQQSPPPWVPPLRAVDLVEVATSDRNSNRNTSSANGDRSGLLQRDMVEGSSANAPSLLQARTFVPASWGARGVRNVPFHGLRRRQYVQTVQQQKQRDKRELSGASCVEMPATDVNADYNHQGGALGQDTRPPRLTRAALDVFQRAQAAANIPATPPQPQASPPQCYSAPQPYLTNPRYAEQQAKARAGHATATPGTPLVEEVIPEPPSPYRPVLSTPSRGPGQAGAPLSHTATTHGANAYRPAHTVIEPQRMTAAQSLPSLSPRSRSPAPALGGRAGHIPTHSPSPAPVAPTYEAEPRMRPAGPAHGAVPWPHQQADATAGMALPNLGQPGHPQPHLRNFPRPVRSLRTDIVTPRASSPSSAPLASEGRPQRATAVPPFLPQLRSSRQTYRATAAGAPLAVPSTPKAASVPLLQGREVAEVGEVRGRRPTSLLHGLRTQKEQRQGRRAGLRR